MPSNFCGLRSAPPRPITFQGRRHRAAQRRAALTVRLLFLQPFPRLVEIVQMLGSSNLVMMSSLAEFAGARADDVALYRQGVGISAEQGCGSFGSRGTSRLVVRGQPNALPAVLLG